MASIAKVNGVQELQEFVFEGEEATETVIETEKVSQYEGKVVKITGKLN